MLGQNDYFPIQKKTGPGYDKQTTTSPIYTDRLRTYIRYNQRLKINVLDIAIEKTDTNA